jgi:AraC family transcriptional regulator
MAGVARRRARVPGVGAVRDRGRRSTGGALELVRSPVADILSPPVHSSALRPGWHRALIELHHVSPWEGEARLAAHVVSLIVRPTHRLVCRLEGRPATSASVAADDLVVIPAGHAHWGAWDAPTEFLLAFVTPEAMVQAVEDDGYRAARADLRYRFRARDDQLAGLLRALHAELTGPVPEDRLYVDTLGVALAVHLLRVYGTQPLPLPRPNGRLSRSRLRVVLDYLNAHLSQNVRLDELAALAGMSPFHFLRVFTASCGLSPHRYLLHRRIEVARDALERQDVSLAELACRLGFVDQSHFTHHFRRLTGVAPGRLQRERRTARAVDPDRTVPRTLSRRA